MQEAARLRDQLKAAGEDLSSSDESKEVTYTSTMETRSIRVTATRCALNTFPCVTITHGIQGVHPSRVYGSVNVVVHAVRLCRKGVRPRRARSFLCTKST